MGVWGLGFRILNPKPYKPETVTRWASVRDTMRAAMRHHGTSEYFKVKGALRVAVSAGASTSTSASPRSGSWSESAREAALAHARHLTLCHGSYPCPRPGSRRSARKSGEAGGGISHRRGAPHWPARAACVHQRAAVWRPWKCGGLRLCDGPGRSPWLKFGSSASRAQGRMFQRDGLEFRFRV